MSEPDPTSGTEESPAANGSGPAPGDSGAEAVDGEKSHEETKDGVETKDNVETDDTEDKIEGDENGLKTVEDKDKGEAEEKEIKDVDTMEVGETKTVDAKDVENVDAEDVKEVALEDVKTVDAEDAKVVGAKDVKMSDVEDVKDEEKGHEDKGEEEGAGQQKEEIEAVEEKDGGETETKVDENKEEETPKKRARSKKVRDKGKGVGEKREGTKSKITKESFSTPITISIERPVRERKTVERLVEVIEKEPNKNFIIEKGRGTPLKDIPNVAYKLAKRKPPDLKLLHQTLYGRKGKAVDFKNHILQFSGFVWHESDEKQRAKMKEKLDKYVKEALLDFCDLFDIPVSKTNIRKEDLVTKLLDFIVAPHATTDVILAEKEQATPSGKRKRVSRGSASKSLESTPVKRSRKKHTSEDTPSTTKRSTQEDEDDDEEEDADRGASTEDEATKHSESEEKENESEEAAQEDDDYDSGKDKQIMKKYSKKRGSVSTEKVKAEISSKKATLLSTTKSPKRTSSSSKCPKAEESDDVGAKVFTRKKKVDMPKKTSTLKQETKEKKSSGKKVAKGKGKSEEAAQSGPSKEELRKSISDILKGVDFNTATFTDILKKLAAHYKMDMAPRKTSIKLLIQEELTKLAEEAEENEEDEDEEDA
ncbi:DEK domain-containing chromatin-associated protein 1-like [Typha angustifolia]|uniref:DEK domain-containing chromatin-associated protein 1-like n=1 Tax=Typha angustifolia TaxID=59011 RepID=UPI003C2C790A